MNIILLKDKQHPNETINLSISQMNDLIVLLNAKNIPDHHIDHINTLLKDVDTMELSDKAFLKLINTKQGTLVKYLAKELKIVPINYYRNLWMLIGMSVFGLPIGMMMGMLLKNIGLFAIGLPIGMVIGIGVGMSLDQKAKEQGNQLNIALKHY